MGLITGLVLGILFGIVLVMAFVYSENLRSKRRSQLASAVATLSKLTMEETRLLFPKDLFPPWVVFTEFEKVNWLNQELEKIWHYVDQAASEMIRTIAEPILEQYRPSVLSSLKFSKLTLGTVAPQCTGIKVVDHDSSGFIMELELQWDGNPNIVLDVKPLIGVSLPIQVKNVKFTGIFRLIFKPLLEVIPCFGAVTYSLREKKNLDFTLKVVGGDIKTIPMVANAIENTIKDAVEDSLLWPVRTVIPIIPGDYSDLELRPVGVLGVKLVQAKNLLNKDIIGKSDPFAIVYIRPKRELTKKSKTINNQLNPVWNEYYEFEVEDVATQHLTVKIFDEEGVQEAELIGCTQVPLMDLKPGELKELYLPLVKDLENKARDKKQRGLVHLELLYRPLSMENGISGPFGMDSNGIGMTSLEKFWTDGMKKEGITSSVPGKRKDIIRGVLSVTVKRAEALNATDLSGKADPYVVLRLKKSDAKKKTRVVPKNLNPGWNQTFDFVVEDALHEMLILEVWDHDTFGRDFLGRCALTLTKVLHESEYDADYSLDAVPSGRIFLHLKWTPQPFGLDPSS